MKRGLVGLLGAGLLIAAVVTLIGVFSAYNWRAVNSGGPFFPVVQLLAQLWGWNNVQLAALVGFFLVFCVGAVVLFAALRTPGASSDRPRGAGPLEYALLIAVLAVVVVATLVLLGPQISFCSAPPSQTPTHLEC